MAPPGRPSAGPPPGGPPPGYPGSPPPGHPGAPPGYAQAPYVPLKPHRGAVVLVLGICGLAVCVICGIIAWVMANADLREMNEGLMDRSGYQMTNAGRVCGIISVVFACLSVVVFIVYMIFIAALLSQR